MSRIIVMRHAKAERGDNKSDFDRTLELRGWQEADIVGSRLVAAGFVPDRVLCSAARRTRDTLSAVLPHLRGNTTVDIRLRLYDADERDLREALRSTRANCVLLIGHNPSVHALARDLCGREAAPELSQGFPTSHAAVFAVGFGLDTAKFEAFVTPGLTAPQ